MKKLAITLVVALALLVAADFGSAAIAEYQVSKRVAERLKLQENPEVSIKGFPFLTQVAAGDYRDVRMKADAVPVGPFDQLGIEADLHGAKISTAQVIQGTADEVTVDELVARVKLRAADVARLIGIQDLTIEPATADALKDDATGEIDPADEKIAEGSDPTKALVRLSGTVNIAGSDNKVQVVSVLSLEGDKMRIAPRELELNNSTFGQIDLPPLFERSVLEQFKTTLDPGMLPFEVRPTGVPVERGALIVEGLAQDVQLTSNGVRTG